MTQPEDAPNRTLADVQADLDEVERKLAQQQHLDLDSLYWRDRLHRLEADGALPLNDLHDRWMELQSIWADRAKASQNGEASAPHKQTYVKVNAPVDVGVATMVAALSMFPTLVTISSCEGRATITFTFGDSLEQAIRFYSWFTIEAYRYVRRGTFSLHIVDVAGDTHPIFEMVFPPDAADTLATAISSLARQGFG